MYSFDKRKWGKFFLLVVSGFICFGCSENEDKRSHEKEKEISAFSRSDFSAIESGDLIVKRGKGRISRMIAENLGEKVPLSHCGILVKSGDTTYVIHSVAKELTGIDGVQRADLDVFLRDCIKGTVYIVRYKAEPETRYSIANTARRYLSQKVPFDYELNYADTGKVNCSEFVQVVLQNASGKDLFRRIRVRENYPLAFNSLLDTVNFKIIYNY